MISFKDYLEEKKKDPCWTGYEAIGMKEKNGKKVDYTIVGTEESDALSGKISIKSPFGQAVIGKKKGDEFSFNAPSGSVSYKLIDIK